MSDFMKLVLQPYGMRSKCHLDVYIKADIARNKILKRLEIRLEQSQSWQREVYAIFNLQNDMVVFVNCISLRPFKLGSR